MAFTERVTFFTEDTEARITRREKILTSLNEYRAKVMEKSICLYCQNGGEMNQAIPELDRRINPELSPDKFSVEKSIICLVLPNLGIVVGPEALTKPIIKCPFFKER